MEKKPTEIILMKPRPRVPTDDTKRRLDPQRTSTGEQQNSTGEYVRPTATRHDFHLSRRLFHLSTGVGAATVYNLFVTRSQAIAIVGGAVSVLYLLEQIRINYPKLAEPLTFINRFLLRAEERLKESSSVPMAIAILLTILTFPKPAAVIAIYTLGIGDPASAIVGIAWGRHRYVEKKSVEGSIAFGSSVFMITYLVLLHEYGEHSFALFSVSLMISIVGTALEAIPLKIDDNLTIPLFMGFITWLFATFFGFVM